MTSSYENCERVIEDVIGCPSLEVFNATFNALFSMACEEGKQLSVSSITDFDFNDNQPLQGEVYETGADWHYVWTRDTAYSAHLGMCVLDPVRVCHSLEFKLSKGKEKAISSKAISSEALYIVQDTGSGGSWPVSTDRVCWALGAMETINWLDEPLRSQFKRKAYDAMRYTCEQDREIIFDDRDGLYRGEQSFLDWRAQTYPLWVNTNLSPICSSKSLSTNACHYYILQSVSKLAIDFEDIQISEIYRLRAERLKIQIMHNFRDTSNERFHSLKMSEECSVKSSQRDLLGESLLILLNICDINVGCKIMASYPHCPLGPSVIWPQLRNRRKYHNYSIWPFVTTYCALSAKYIKNEEVFNNCIDSLVRGGVVNLSNMENYSWWDMDPKQTVINSKRQLWSVAGYIGAVVKGIFGLTVSSEGITVSPFFNKTYKI
eukprot:GHVL01007861.1.p1 GENE.GHVL01007861.1~~GHVL01007861.1.p1  ORF type:complete len:475 (+),score=79.54 GHVL01007861.1:129-1427(+)